MSTLRWAVASGNWSSPATWNGGTVPGPGDDVRTNNFVVNLDQSISVDRLSNKNSTPAVNGGRFTFNPTFDLTVTVALGILLDDVQWGTSGDTFLLVSSGSGSLTINAPFLYGTFVTSGATVMLQSGYTGAVTINAVMYGGWRGPALYINTGATPSSVTINGNIFGPDVSGFSGNPSTLYINGTVPVMHIYGNVTGGIIGNAHSAIRWLSSSIDTVIHVHGDVKGGPGATAIGQNGIDCSPSFGSNTNFLYLYGKLTGTIAGNAVVSNGNAYIRASGAEMKSLGLYTAITHSAGGTPKPMRLSGSIAVTADGQLSVAGPFVAIAGEPLSITVLNDSNYPTNMNGTPVLLAQGSSGTDVPVAGNAAEVESRAVGTIFTVEEEDPNLVVLTLPSELDSTDVPEMADQINDVFAPPSAVISGWLTVTAKGILVMADTADANGSPDYVPVAGTVTLTPNTTKPLRQLSTGDILLTSVVVATFDSNGVMSFDGVSDVRVIAPQWSDLSNTAWKWQAEVRPGAGQSWSAWSVSFTGAPGATVNLSSLLT